ncbi:MAG: alpha-glucosidase [Anaerolineaceae bacterium]|nr:alpha-glucosidase [Anaerolineaceae bacterium]
MNNNWLWWKHGVVYQIYPRSFKDSNKDGIGDIQGVIQKLDYIKTLGVDAIWLSPVYPSPDVDFGYDVSDYMDIDPKFGSLAIFDELIRESKKRDLHIIMDLVINHTSDQHPWFIESRSSRQSPKRDWYIWKDPKRNGAPPNNWEAVFGGKGWTFDELTGQYYYHMFYKEQPDLNWRNPEVREAMMNVFKFWMERGVDGFRLDVFNMYYKNADFPDNPAKMGIRGFDRQKHIHDFDQPELMEVVEEIRSLLDQYPEKFVVGETFLDTPQKAAKYCAPGKFHGAFNFEMTKLPWNPKRFFKAVQKWEDALNPEAWPSNVLNNHDVIRIATRLRASQDDERLKLAAALLLTLRGTPFLYYGEEIGMRDIPIKKSQIKDPIGKKYWPFHIGRDGCRAPMQWDQSLNAGFSETEPWLPVHADYKKRNVKKQESHPDSLLNFYKRLIKIRRENAALHKGLFLPVTYDSRNLMAFLRQTNGQTIMVVINFKKRPAQLFLGRELRNAKWKLLLSNKRQAANIHSNGLMQLASEEVIILLEDKE